MRRETDASGRVVNETSTVVTEPGSQMFKSKFAVHKSEPAFHRLSRDARLVRRAMEVLASDVYVHQSRLNFQPAFIGTGFTPHSAFETWAAEDGLRLPRALSAVVLLDQNIPHNGSLMVVPGSHKYYIACAGHTPQNNWESSLLRQKVGSPAPDLVTEVVNRTSGKRMGDKGRVGAGGEILYCTGQPGDVIFFDCNLLHMSHNNISPWSRTNAFFVFNSVENAPSEPFHAPTPRPEHIATRDPAWTNPIRPIDDRIAPGSF
jgi:ectoine hydroxylase